MIGTIISSFSFWLGVLLCLWYILYPYLYSRVKTSSGKVWVPINNEHRLCGDSRIYASMVQEARFNFFKYQHPCASEIGNLGIDYTRATSYRTAALLSLFIKDERIAFTISFSLSVLIQYILIFYASFYLFTDISIAFLIAVLVIFWYRTLEFINMESGIRSCYAYIVGILLNSNRVRR